MTAGVDIAAGDGVQLSTQLTRRRAAGRGEMADVSPFRIFFYLNALNLYYGALRNTPHRRLDIIAFCRNIIRELAASQLPDPVADGNKFYKKPPSWNGPKA